MALTVLMPTYNCSEYIGDAIRSILNQTFQDFEFLIIDDGSTDNTEVIVANLNDSRIRYIKKIHTCFADSLNHGLEISNNDLILRMDADDIASPELMEKQYNLYSTRTLKYWIGCNYAVFYENKKHISYLVKNPLAHSDIIKSMILHGSISHSGSIFNRTFLMRLGGYKILDAFEDYEFWLRGLEEFVFENNEEILLYVRQRKVSLSRINIKHKYKLFYSIQQPYYENECDLFANMEINRKESLRGWREYFYGDKKLSRVYWFKAFPHIDLRVFLGIMISLLPEDLFIKFKESRVRFRFKYLIEYFTRKNKRVRFFLRNFNYMPDREPKR